MASAMTFAAVLALCALMHISLGSHVYHKAIPRSSPRSALQNEAEMDPRYWHDEATAALKERLIDRERRGRAKNVVMFLGDGMSIPTLTAARAMLGQREGRTGEEGRLSFETFPTVGLAKTYCFDAQVADSACSATAYLCGAKANSGTLGVTPHVLRGDCTAATDEAHHVHSIASWALEDGRDAGVVTTTRITHASPGGVYAHSADRDWESDADVMKACGDVTRQEDIAMQLVHSYPGNRFKVILGGGRREFLPKDTFDEEGTQGRRLDGRNLIEEWKSDKKARKVSHEYVWNREQLLNVTSSPPEYLLGLFEGDHLQYHLESDAKTEPTLAELTEAAIRSLSRNSRGFFLFVEGGRIDHAHHDNLPTLALDETIELSKAVDVARNMLHIDDSLIVTTADHAHVMSFAGYAPRGNDVVGPAGVADDNVPYMTLSYANGPGFRSHIAPGVRDDLTQYDYHSPSFRFGAGVPLASETHGGEDVAVFAWGAQHSAFAGAMEQSQLPHLMAFASCLLPQLRPHECDAGQHN